MGGCKSYNALNDLIRHSWLRELDGTVTMHTLIKETVQITCQPTMQSCMPCKILSDRISELEGEITGH